MSMTLKLAQLSSLASILRPVLTKRCGFVLQPREQLGERFCLAASLLAENTYLRGVRLERMHFRFRSKPLYCETKFMTGASIPYSIVPTVLFVHIPSSRNAGCRPVKAMWVTRRLLWELSSLSPLALGHAREEQWHWHRYKSS